MTYPLRLDPDKDVIRDAAGRCVAFAMEAALSIEDIFRGLTGSRIALALPLATHQLGAAAGDCAVIVSDAGGRLLFETYAEHASEIVRKLTEAAR